MFPVGEWKPGKIVRPAAEVDAATAAMTTATAVEMRSDDFMTVLRFDDERIVRRPGNAHVTAP
jgi:hypothetical protein